MKRKRIKIKRKRNIIISIMILLLTVSALSIKYYLEISQQKKELQTDIASVKNDISQLEKEVQSISEQIDKLNKDKIAIQEEVSNLEKAVINPRMISHRGYNEVAPENNLLAYKTAVEDGFTELETDLYFTKDNIPVLSHDNRIYKTARNLDGSFLDENLRITNLTLEELYQFDFGIYKDQKYAGTKITTFEELLKYASEEAKVEFLHVELKTTLSYQQKEYLVNLVNKYNLQEKVGWQSFIWSEFLDFNILAPKMQLEVLSSRYTDEMLSTLNELNNGQRNVVASLSSNLTSVQMAVSSGYEVYVWTIDSEDVLENFKGLNVTAYMTNGTREIERVIKEESFAQIEGYQKKLVEIESSISANEEKLSILSGKKSSKESELVDKQKALDKLPFFLQNNNNLGDFGLKISLDLFSFLGYNAGKYNL